MPKKILTRSVTISGWVLEQTKSGIVKREATPEQMVRKVAAVLKVTFPNTPVTITINSAC